MDRTLADSLGFRRRQAPTGASAYRVFVRNPVLPFRIGAHEHEARASQRVRVWRGDEREAPATYADGWIRRKYRTGGRKGTLMVINTVGHLAEAAWHHPEIAASYAWVEVRLMTHTPKSVTDKDFELARKIEEVVQWRPDAGSALEGTPNKDQRFAYIAYDKRAARPVTRPPPGARSARGRDRSRRSPTP